MEQEILMLKEDGRSERRCRLLQFRPEAFAVLLICSEEQLLLGNVKCLAPDYPFSLDAREAELLGVSCEELLDVFCRVSIPRENPQNAGFDLSRLVLVNRASGHALEVRRPGLPLIALAQH